MKLPRPTYSAVVATLALFLAIGGTSYAATKLAKNSVTSREVKDHSLLRKDFKNGQLPRGPVGPRGVQGPRGATGAPGLSGLVAVDSVHVDLAPGDVTPIDFDAQCPPGTTVVGTGFYSSIADVGFVEKFGSFVGGVMFNNTGVTATNLHVQAICAAVTPPAAGALAARSASDALGTFEGRRAEVLAALK